MALPRTSSRVRLAHVFGARVRELRKAVGLTGEQLAARVPVSASTLSRIENGLSGPPADETIMRLASVLGVREVELLHLAGRAIDPLAFEERVLAVLSRLTEEQRAGFDRLEAALTSLRDDRGPR